MRGASSPNAKLTGDFANGSEATRIGDCFPFRNFAKNSSPCNFRLLQQYLPIATKVHRGKNDLFGSPRGRVAIRPAMQRTLGNGIKHMRRLGWLSLAARLELRGLKVRNGYCDEKACA